VSEQEIAMRLASVREVIAREATRAPVRVMCVTKRFGAPVVRAALRAGVTECGENYADELVAKDAEMRDGKGDHPRWHFIGALQRNKIARIAPLCGGVHSVCREVEIGALARHEFMGEVYVQVAPSEATSGRNGAAPRDVAQLVVLAQGLGLNVVGLMGMALLGPADATREYFRGVRALADDLGLRGCSMGMSGDFEIALQEGSTFIRLGTYLLGERA